MREGGWVLTEIDVLGVFSEDEGVRCELFDEELC